MKYKGNAKEVVGEISIAKEVVGEISIAKEVVDESV